MSESDTAQPHDAIIQRYSGLAQAALAGESITDCDPGEFAAGCFGSAAYTTEDDLPEGALRASLGCGNPLAVAEIDEGEIVLDLGSGGGLDVLLAARRVGPTGRVYGLDASPDMLHLARTHAEQAGATNVEFLRGHLENIPLPDAAVDVVISNCVITLSTDKPRALAEAFRVLTPGGRLGITDIVADGTIPAAERSEAEHRIGCPAGTLTGAEYLDTLTSIGFAHPEVTLTHQAAPGLHSAIVRATKPRPH